jgi:hypothetical protein
MSWREEIAKCEKEIEYNRKHIAKIEGLVIADEILSELSKDREKVLARVRSAIIMGRGSNGRR